MTPVPRQIPYGHHIWWMCRLRGAYIGPTNTWCGYKILLDLWDVVITIQENNFSIITIQSRCGTPTPMAGISVSWLKYPIENSSNHFLESGLELWTSSNGVVILRPSWPGTWLSIMAACCTDKHQNYRPTCFSVMNARAIWIIVRHVRSANTFGDWRPEGTAMMLEKFDNIH